MPGLGSTNSVHVCWGVPCGENVWFLLEMKSVDRSLSPWADNTTDGANSEPIQKYSNQQLKGRE